MNFFLIRHASHDLLNKRLAGRQPGVHLNARGVQEAAALAERLGDLGIARVYTSPMERTRETAEPIARKLGCELLEAPALLEIDYGDWTNLTLEEAARDERWREYNAFRSGTRVPGGESLRDVQVRVVGEMERLRDAGGDETVALVSHCDVIRAAVMNFLAIPLDFVLRVEISPASVSIVRLDHWGARVLCLNAGGELPILEHQERNH